MSLICFKSIAGILILLTGLIAVIYPLKMRARPTHHPFLEMCDAFASGIFLGAALFHMLPDALAGFAADLGNVHFPLAEFLCAGGFLVLLFLERLARLPYTTHSANMLPYTIAIILVIHSLIEGIVLGINTTLATASVIFLAIIAHKSSESFALAIVLNRSRIAFSILIIIIVLFALMTPFGIALGTAITQFLLYKSAQLMTAGFNAFAAGTFLYMSTLHHINHHEREHEAENMWEFVFLVSGLVIMGGLAYWA